MRSYNNHTPNQPCTTRRQDVAEPATSAPIIERLANIVREGAATAYNLVDLIAETPEVIHWLRTKMLSGMDTNGNGGKSRAPFKLSLMFAADQEARTLAYWADLYGIRPSLSDGLWIESGTIMGVCGDDLAVVDELACRLAEKIANGAAFSVEMATDPEYGFWHVRQQHFRNWPELAAHFASKDLQDRTKEVLDDTAVLF